MRFNNSNNILLKDYWLFLLESEFVFTLYLWPFTVNVDDSCVFLFIDLFFHQSTPTVLQTNSVNRPKALRCTQGHICCVDIGGVLPSLWERCHFGLGLPFWGNRRRSQALNILLWVLCVKMKRSRATQNEAVWERKKQRRKFGHHGLGFMFSRGVIRVVRDMGREGHGLNDCLHNRCDRCL